MTAVASHPKLNLDALIAALARVAAENYKREEPHRSDVSDDSDPDRAERAPLRRKADAA